MLPLLILGMFGNLQLMFVTWRHKQLQHRNGILISQLFEMKNAIEILTGNSKMTRAACYNTIFLYGFSFSMASIAMLFLAIDRLIAVSSPIK
ncbi:unnamed protein product [Gongylonema pulchrum]|uniref:G_PROTEIN_RECEP_F1_2 domain-containing protein n=1 Tax=Gongylonema pulchrum TaxID=637853 RepID=A0A183EIV8_9BILA|nr:unnamed protein product [Gongylonema pulchrum]